MNQECGIIEVISNILKIFKKFSILRSMVSNIQCYL